MNTRTITGEDKGKRLDVWLHEAMPEHSRARWQQLIKSGHVLVEQKTVKPNHKLRVDEVILVEIPPPESIELQAEDIPLDVLYEDSDLLVLNKPAGLVVHPAPGNYTGTLVNSLMHHCKDLSGIGGELRPGIVHRLDKDTSGVLVVAKNEAALNELTRQFKSREVHKQYTALVWGIPGMLSGTIKTLIGRDPRNRKKMSARTEAGKQAVTKYRVDETFKELSLLNVEIKTGRTHQIRVHLSHIGHPVVGDRLYGRARVHQLPAPAERQMLHAAHLAFRHPGTDESLAFDAPLPDDMEMLIQALRLDH